MKFSRCGRLAGFLLLAALPAAEAWGDIPTYPDWWIPLAGPGHSCVTGVRIYYPAENQTTVFSAPASINTVAMPILGCQGTSGYQAYFFAQSLTGSQYYNCMGGGPVFGCNLYIDQPGTYTVVAAIQDYGKYVRSANYATIVVNP